MNYVYNTDINMHIYRIEFTILGDMLAISKGRGADVVIFGTCLYVGAAAFLRKFQVSCFGMMRVKNWVLLEQKKNLLQLK